MFSSKSQEWETPSELFRALDEEFHFTLDPCCTHENAKCEKHYTKEENGLLQSWAGETVFCNPPYGKGMGKWIEKACMSGGVDGTTVVMLIPARTDTIAFHKYIWHKAEIRFLQGRLHFSDKGRAPFPSMICIWR